MTDKQIAAWPWKSILLILFLIIAGWPAWEYYAVLIEFWWEGRICIL